MEKYPNQNQYATENKSSHRFVPSQNGINITAERHRNTLSRKIHGGKILMECHKDKDMPKERLSFICIIIYEDTQTAHDNQTVDDQDPLRIIRKETDEFIQIKVQGFPLADDSAKPLIFYRPE